MRILWRIVRLMPRCRDESGNHLVLVHGLQSIGPCSYDRHDHLTSATPRSADYCTEILGAERAAHLLHEVAPHSADQLILQQTRWKHGHIGEKDMGRRLYSVLLANFQLSSLQLRSFIPPLRR